MGLICSPSLIGKICQKLLKIAKTKSTASIVDKDKESMVGSVVWIVYDQNHYFGLGPIPKPKPKLADTFSRYRNWYHNYILKGESS